MAPRRRKLRGRRHGRWPCWSELQLDILDLVLQKLPLRDGIAFGNVCTSWRSVFVDRRRLSRPPPCLNLTTFMFGTASCMLERQPWSQLRKLQFPKPKLVGSEWVVGSTLGWLVIATYADGLRLQNPISNQHIQLPSMVSGGLSVLHGKRGYTYFGVAHVILSSDPTSKDCILVARGYTISTFRLVWCRPGDQEWTTLLTPDTSVFHEVFHKGKMYTLGYVENINVHSLDEQQEMRFSGTIAGLSSNWFHEKRLVESGGELLLVIYNKKDDDIPDDERRVVDLFRLEEERWVRVESLGDRVLLIGSTYAESICTQRLMGSCFESNCVYYPSFNYQEIEKYCTANGHHETMPLPIVNGGIVVKVEWMAVQTW